jgi:glutaminyl-tRNA synthetase
VIDSLENITHSCCTLEFEVRRESYYWLLHELDLYKPKVWEYSRLNVEYNVMSKRRLLRLVTENHVNGWDDPRLLTLNGLRRRGYTPEAIADFCNTIGVSRTETMIPVDKLEYAIRMRLEDIARRTMVVQDPVRVVLTNYPEEKVEDLRAPNFPKDESRGFSSMPFSRIVYIDRSDIRLKDDKDFYGLAPGKEVRLKYAYNIRATDIHTDKDGNITQILATVDLSNANKCKGMIHWVAEPQPGKTPLTVEIRLYENLFKSRDPMEIAGEWLQDINPNSLRVIKNAYASPSVLGSKAGDKFQFERVAFFVVDPDSTESHLVFNRTVNLKDSKGKGKGAA